MPPTTVSELPDEIHETYSCQVVEPGKENIGESTVQKKDDEEIDVVGLTDDAKTNGEFTEPSLPEEYYQTIELMHGVSKDEIEKEEIDLTGDNNQPPHHTAPLQKKNEQEEKR